MFKRDMKNFNSYIKTENEPEEGEIVDEYDLIVSSDEELCMRNRIRQLEAENEEIEQIAVISRSYVDKINHLDADRAAQVPTDVSSISSTEFVTPKKRKRRKSRERKRKHFHRPHQHDGTLRHTNIHQLPAKTHSKRTHCKRRQKLFAKKYKKIHSNHFMHKELNEECLSIESLESCDSSPLSDTNNYVCDWLDLKRRKESYNKEKFITRDTLRLAVARNNNESRLNSKNYCLKDKLLGQELQVQPTNTVINDRYNFVEACVISDENNDDDDDVQVIENEPDIHTIEEDSTDSMEEKELRLIALKSAVLKKHMARKMRNAEAAYSPTDFDEMLSSGILPQESNIDIVDLDMGDVQTTCVSVSPEASPELMMLEDQDEIQQMVDCKPVDMDIANSDSEEATVDSWAKDVESFPNFCLDSYDFSKNVQYEFYMQKLHELPPPPPGVDDYEDVPAPPPFHMLHIPDDRKIDACNEESVHNRQSMGKQEICAPENKKAQSDIALLPKTECCIKDDEDEEEEEALRALLLSKFQSPKNKRQRAAKEELPDQNRSKPIPTEIILKEAVKRLKVHSQVENCKKDSVVGSYIKEELIVGDNIEEHKNENSSDSVSRLDELRNRLSVHKNQSQPANKDIGKDNFEHSETSASHNRISSEHAVVLNSAGVSNTIDISDITRRLQIIKENVLNATCKISNVKPPTCENFTHHEQSSNENKIKEPNQSPTENVFQLNQQVSNINVNTDPFKKESNNVLAQNKTVEANFDVTANQTTFKVTIMNNSAFKSEDKDISHNDHNDANCKENKNNSPKKGLAVNCNDNKRNKVVETNNKNLVKITNKISSNGENNAQTGNITLMKDMKVSSASSCLLQRTKKIVKPNKVINTNVDLNSKVVSQASEESKLVLKKSKDQMSSSLSNVTDNTRLITSIDQVKHMYKISPIVIDLQHSSNDSSEDDSKGNHDSVYQPLYDYNDNVSPLSLNLGSPSRTPLRSNSPVDRSADGIVGQTDLEAFRVKTKISLPAAEKKLSTNSTDEGGKLNKTPLAVRHLPEAAQSEYRKLVHRMKLLENKRKLANNEENKKQCPTNKKNCTSLSAMEGSSKEKDKSDCANAAPKTTLVKKVLLKNASNSTTPTEGTASAKQLSNLPSISTKLHKSNVLRSYENLYMKFGTGIVNNLDKSIKLVEEAKKTKLAKLMLENRLKELKAEMDILQEKHKAEQQKMSRIYPNICATNEIITSLRQKRSKVFKAATNLGKSLKGKDYRLNNDLKEVITTKSNKLAAEIKIVNSLKAQDFKKMEKMEKMDVAAERQETHNKEQEKIGDCKTKSNGNNAGIKANSNITTNNIMIRSEICEEDKEKHNHESVLKTEISGNTEFQDSVPNVLKCDENSADAGGMDMTVISNKAHSDNESKQTSHLPSYISPLVHLRNIDSDMDPNGVICPYDLMGNCEDVTCKYVHITSPKDKT